MLLQGIGPLRVALAVSNPVCPITKIVAQSDPVFATNFWCFFYFRVIGEIPGHQPLVAAPILLRNRQILVDSFKQGREALFVFDNPKALLTDGQRDTKRHKPGVLQVVYPLAGPETRDCFLLKVLGYIGPCAIFQVAFEERNVPIDGFLDGPRPHQMTLGRGCQE